MAFFERFKITNADRNIPINPAQDENVILLRRVVQLLQSLAVVDAAQRQRIVVDGTVVLGAGAASVGTVVLGAGAASVGTVVLGAGAAAIGSVGIAGQNSQAIFIEQFRLTYDNALRSKLSFS